MLARRAAVRREYASELPDSSPEQAQESQAGIDDLSAALEIDPQNVQWRRNHISWLIALNRAESALREVRDALQTSPNDFDFILLKGHALMRLNRPDEAIAAAETGLALTEQCAESSMLQEHLNRLRHAFDPPPSRAEIERQIAEDDLELYAKPEPGVLANGFRCTFENKHQFEQKVTFRGSYFLVRGRAHKAKGELTEALNDFEYADLIGPADAGSIELCELEIDMKLYYDAVSTCRKLVDYNVIYILGDSALSYKIANFLLEDGDIKGACRLVWHPYTRPLKASANSELRALQRRVARTMRAAGMTDCERITRP